MKNNYAKHEWEIISIATQDIITASGLGKINQFGLDEDILNDPLDNWDWEI